MLKALKVIALITAASIIFGIGYLFHWYKSWATSPVVVLIENQSEHNLTNIKLLFKSQVSGVLEIPITQNNKQIKLGYFPSSEGSFILEATFDSGKVVKHSEGYVEAGYSIDLVLTENGFKRHP
ncbi:MAG TPA: hypothetical protein VK967_01305 [Methylotenera sp.]|nr:hypothetical protein [Methylotenera sp.]